MSFHLPALHYLPGMWFCCSLQHNATIKKKKMRFAATSGDEQGQAAWVILFLFQIKSWVVIAFSVHFVTLERESSNQSIKKLWCLYLNILNISQMITLIYNLFTTIRHQRHRHTNASSFSRSQIAVVPLLSNPIILPSTLRLIKLLILSWCLIL